MAAGTKVGEAYIELQARMAKFESQLKSAEVMTGKSVGKMQAKFQALAPTMKKVGMGMAVAGGVITAALGLTAKSAMSFNKEMANIATLIPGATKRVVELKKAIRVMAVDVGKSTADLAQGGYQVISAFGDTADTVDILRISARAATAGVATTTEAINLLSAVTKGYGDTSKEAVKRASDLAFQTVTLGQTTFPELAASIGRVIPLAAEMGVKEEELFAVMATGTGVTGKAAEVSTQLRGAIQSLMAPTADMIILLEKEGYASGKAMLADLGLAGSLELVKKRADESNTPLQKYISSIEGQTIALALTGTQADNYTEKLAAMRDAAGLTDIAFKEQTEGINKAGFAFEQAKIQIGVLGQEIGDKLLPMVVPLIEKVSTVVKNMSKWIEINPELSSSIVKFTAVLGPLLIGLGAFLIILPGLASLMISTGTIIATVLAAIATPIGLLVAMIAGLVIAWKLGWKKISEITSKLVEIVVMPTIKFVGEKIENLADWIQEKMGIPEEARRGVWELTDISTVIGFIVDLVWKGITSAGKMITDITEWVKENAKIEKIDQLGTRIEQFFIDLPEPAKWMFLIAGKAFQYTALAYGIWSAVNALISKLKLPALTPIRLTFDIILVVGTFLIGWDVGKWIEENIKPVSDFIQKEVDKFQEKHPLLWEQFIAAPLISTTGIKAIALYISEAIVSAIDLGFETAAEFIGGLVEKWITEPISKAFREADWGQVWTDFVDGMIWPFKKIWEGIKWEWLKFENLMAALKKAWEDIDWSWFGFDKVKDFFKDIWESFDWSWLSWENFVTALQEAWDNTDWGWFGNSIKWLFGLFQKDIEKAAVALEVDWRIWPKADEQTKKVIDNIDKIGKTVEKEIGTKIPKELQLMSIALIASESSFDKNAKAADKLGNEYKGLGQTGKAAVKDLEGMGLVIDDINDPTQAASATMAYFSKILKANEGDVKKSILIYKGWGTELKKQGGNIEKMPKEAKRQLDIYLKLLEDFAGDSLFYGTLAGKQFVWGGSPGGVVGEIEEGNKGLQKTLDKMLGSMNNMTENMSKAFEPIIGIFELIFQGVVNTIKAFDQEAGEEFESFVNDTFALFRSLFGDIEDETEEMSLEVRRLFRDIEVTVEEMSLEVRRLFRDIEVDVKDTTKDIAGEFEKMWERMGEAAKEHFSKMENYLGDVLNALADVISGTKSLGDALLDLAYSIPVIGGIAEAVVNLGKAIIAELDGSAQAARDLEKALFWIGENTNTLSEAFKDVGMSLTGSIENAERAIKSLIQTQEDLALNTREKLIKELDNYYDYRVLKEMDLTELLALSAETRGKLETDSMEKSLEERIAYLQSLVDAETATDAQIKELAELRTTQTEENAAREKDAKVGTLQAIEEAYAKESALIDKKIGLLQVEIKLLMAAALAEQGNLAAAEKLRKEALKDLRNLLYTEEELLEMEEEKRKALKETADQTGKMKEAIEEYGKEGKGAADDVRDAFGRTREEIEDLEDSTNQARIGTEQWGDAGWRNAQKITDGFREARIGVELWGKELNKIPTKIDFNVIGHLHMPDIPKIGDQSFSIKGIYAAPYIPSYQVGTPYIPRTQVAVLHPREAVLTAPQAEEWRAGRGGAAGGESRVMERRTIEQHITIQSLIPPDDPILYDRIWREGMKAAYERDSERRAV